MAASANGQHITWRWNVSECSRPCLFALDFDPNIVHTMPLKRPAALATGLESMKRMPWIIRARISSHGVLPACAIGRIEADRLAPPLGVLSNPGE